MEVSSTDQVTTSQEVSKATTSSLKSWMSGDLIKTVVEIIGLICIIVWFHRKTSALTQQVSDLTSRLEEAETTIERHESVLKKIMTLLGNRNAKLSEPAVVSERHATPRQRVETPEPVVEARPVVPEPANSGMDLFGMLLPTLFTGASKAPPAESFPPVSQPTITEIDEQDLDSELKSEIAELSS